MKVAIIGHSYVAMRQRLFEEELRRQLQADGGDVKALFPAQWGQHVRKGGWFVDKPGDMIGYGFPIEAYNDLDTWGPDVVLIQQEAYCASARQAAGWARARKIPYVLFSWENGHSPDAAAAGLMRNAAWNVFGNGDALALGVKGGADPDRASILPQVGVDEKLFCPAAVEKAADIGFWGRHQDPMKGFDVLQRAAGGWSLMTSKEFGYTKDYDAMPARYRSTRLTCVPSLDVPGRPREQFLPAVSAESLMCGVPVVTTNQAAIMEWGRGSPAMWFAEQGDVQSLRETLREALDGAGKFLGMKGREWAVERFSNRAVAAKYVELFEKVVA